MNCVSMLFGTFTFIFLILKISPRKEELKMKNGWIISKNSSKYDKLWIFNTSCYQCLLEISCHSLKLSSYYSIIFSSSFQQRSSDVTLRNYSSCPGRFLVRTNEKGFYYIYYFTYFSVIKDYFNFSYSVVENDKTLDKCLESNFSARCPNITKGKDSNSEYSRFRLYDDSSLFSYRFMHAIAQVESVVYVHGGLSSRNIDDRIFIRYSKNTWHKVAVLSDNEPPCLYSHSLTYYHDNNELVLFGGSKCESRSSLNNLVWIFAIDTRSWTSFHSGDVNAVSGHTSHIFGAILYSFFGLTQSHETEYGLLNAVQKFNLTSRQWMDRISLSNMTPDIGLVHHCSYHFGNEVWIFGGLYPVQYAGHGASKPVVNLKVSNQLYRFNLSNSVWTVRSQSGPRLFLHACIVVNDTFYSIGGLRVTSRSFYNTFRFDLDLALSTSIYYHHLGTMESIAEIVDFTNVGHRISLMGNNSLAMIGGKSSAFHSDITYLRLGNCSSLQSQSACQSFHYGSDDMPIDSKAYSTIPCNYSNCDSCVYKKCIWCSLTNRCVSKLEFIVGYPTGSCEVPRFYGSTCPVRCEQLTDSGCVNCTSLAFCGWCEFRTKTDLSEHLSGHGECIEGTIDGPSKSIHNLNIVNRFCGRTNLLGNWNFLPTKCLSCNCNGHSVCSTQHSYDKYRNSKDSSKAVQHCPQCRGNTTGSNCQYCKEGYYGRPINGRTCTKCKCVRDKLAASCSTDGLCDEFCLEKGRLGHYCEDCDTGNNFSHFHDMCVFRAKINFQYILDKTDHFNKYTDRVNFLLTDMIPNMDLNFKIRCKNNRVAKIRVELFNETGHRRILMQDKYCHGFETLFSRSLFKGHRNYELLFRVSGFLNTSSDMFQLEMMFSQRTEINLPYIFISFFACLSASVLVFFVVYKLRQHINRRAHEYRTLFVLERPFAKIQLPVPEKETTDNTNNNEEASSLFPQTINNNNWSECNIPIISVEPYRAHDSLAQSLSEELRSASNNVLVSLLFVSPKCASLTSSDRRTPQIIIGSTVTKISKLDRKMLLELPTKTSSGTSVMVDRDFDTSVSPSAAEELLTTEV